MTNGQPPAVALLRDGTSQSGRVSRELDPGYARIDERTTRDLLAFARAYAKELRYYGLDDALNPQGDWSGFLGGLDLDAAAAYARAPESLAAAQAEPFERPHRALFLAFLELLARVREQLNTLTGRHLDFFYRDVLRMVRKPARPDRVHVLAELEPGTPQLLLPADTALHAGKDSLGRELVYRTERALLASPVQVARLSSLHAEIRITGISEAIAAVQEALRRNNPGLKQDHFLHLLRIALGQPQPGDPLPVPVYPGVPAAGPPKPVVDFAVLLQTQQLVGVVETELGMPLFDDFRLLMRLRQLRQQQEAADWLRINALLELSGRTRLGDPNAAFGLGGSTDFLGNQAKVLGKTAAELSELYNGLLEVKSLEEAYAVYLNRADVQRFIVGKLFLTIEQFRTLMQTKTVMDNQWSEIDRLLTQAGRVKRGDPGFELPADVRRTHDFDARLAAALGSPDYRVTGGLDGYHAALRAVEQYFYMPAESFKFIMAVATRAPQAAIDAWDWDSVGEIVDQAHGRMVFARRQRALQARAQASPGQPLTALGAVLSAVLGTAAPEPASLQGFIADAIRQLEPLGVAAETLRELQAIAAGQVAAPDWARLSQVLEIAQRNRENFKPPRAEQTEWRNLYPAADARQVRARTAQAAPATLQRWKTFGEGETRREPEPPPAAVFGWALASPLLALSEGQRTVTLTLGLDGSPLSFELDKILALLAPPSGTPLRAGFNPFEVELSTEKGWMAPDAVSLGWLNARMDHPAVAGTDTTGLRALVLGLEIARGRPALAAPTRALHGIEAAAPVLRLMLKPVWSAPEACYLLNSYQVLGRLQLRRLRLAVAATGVQGLSIRNDDTVLDAKKPFEPFGNRPATGSRFYLGHPEIVGKRLDTLVFRVTWMGVPPDLAAHYGNYPSALPNAGFKVAVVLSESGVHKRYGDAVALFKANATEQAELVLTPPKDQGLPRSARTAAADVADWNRHFVWELGTPDFQHAAYPSVALQKSLEMAAAIANKTATVVAASYQVNAPYTPKVKSLSLDYTATAELLTAAAPDAAAAERMFHVEPFGWRELRPEPDQPGCPWLPQYRHEGELLIGLRHVQAPQNVSLLFQMAEGSANPELAPEPVHWSYLSGDRWLTLHDGALLADGTRGFINSGIVELALAPAQPGTRLPGDLYWLRASIARRSGSVCDMVEVHPNAVVARFADDGNAADHLDQALPAQRIDGPVVPLPGLRGLRQPYTSFGGRTAEGDASFRVRVSERLRHRQRAIAPWDYERLVLERFPQVFKVKCLSADPVAHPRKPGHIELIVIPDIRNRFQYDPFEPKASAELIRDIETFLRDKTPPFASVEVKNAHYVPVKVRCGVRFVPGSDEGFCRLRLNEELNRYLSPWAYQEGEDLVIGGSVYANSLINFIELRDYVDYVAEFKLFTSADEGQTFNLLPPSDNYHARAGRPDGVLVAAREHEFDLITQADYRVEGFTGINYMKIELDFMVA